MNTACIEWVGAKTPFGHGVRRVNRKNQYTHRIAYAEKLGVSIEDLKGVVVRHLCDNPACVNPEHLVGGSQADNMNDMRERRRDHKGSQHANAKLTPEDVSFIRKNYKARDRYLGGAALARRFGVTHMVISRVVRGVSYAD
jgi:hypothetical protein